MEPLTLLFFLIIIASFIMETIDSSMGMMYGTILSPLLIGIGFPPADVVPALLLSQTIGGLIGTFGHQRFGNASFSRKSKDLKVSIIILSLGILAVIAGALLGVKVNQTFLSLYISILMLIMGIITLLRIRFKFSWGKILVVGVVSSFNKALSGGGFGPIVTSGQVISGRSGKRSVGATTMSEVEICGASFLAWVIINHKLPHLNLMVALSIGAIFGGILGPYILSKVETSNRTFITIVGILAIASGTYALIKILL